LAKTIKGYGLGEIGEGRNTAHNQKKVNENELREFRTRFGIPISDEDVAKAPFYKPPEDSPEMKYLRERREALGGYVPTRITEKPKLKIPKLEEFSEALESSGDKEASTTMAFVRLFAKLLRDKQIGKYIVPIVPDESRTFGMESLFRQCGIYAHAGQLYEPVDAGQLTYYKEAKDGQLLEEGITEAGSMSSFIAAGTAYATHGINMIPFFIYYSMFGFQRIGDLIWAAADARAKGFMLGGTAGRTTLNGEGLQHQDGHSLLFSMAYPTVRSYDPAYSYEIAIIVMDGMRRMYELGEDAIYYITLENENYHMPAMPKGVEEGVLRGMYKLNSVDAGAKTPKVQLLGSGAILREALRAQELLAEKFQVSSDVWSVTSYRELRREAQAAERWNLLHPTSNPRRSYLEELVGDEEGPWIASSDYVRAVSEQISPWIPGGLYALGTDGLGRSDLRPRLRRHFEVDAENIVLASLRQLARQKKIEMAAVGKAVKQLDIDPEKIDPVTA
jgi:pyruvate dehydrogenase E1 component